MKKHGFSVFVLCMLFTALLGSGCGQNDNPASHIVTDIPNEDYQQTPQEQTDDPIIELPEDDDTPPAEGMVRSPITNEWISEEAAGKRPLAVIIANEAAAIPQYSLSEASVLYEANVEGRMTRLMGIFEDWDKLDKIGNVRSLRTYYAYWSFEWDAFLVHVGGPYYVNYLLDQENTENINEENSQDAAAFFRTTDREMPHNAYVSGEGIHEVLARKKYSPSYRGLTDGQHFQFAAPSDPNTLQQYSDSKSAIYIDMSGCYPSTRCYFEYDDKDKLYYRSQHLSSSTDGPHVDADGNQLTFKNILVQYVKYEDLGDGYLVFQCHDTTMDGWYFTEGRGIHVTWEKTADYSATRYYDDNGNEITLNTGKTMICIVEEGDSFTFH